VFPYGKASARAATITAALAVVIAACSDATGEVQGVQPLKPACTPTKPTATPTGSPTWSTLYADVFGGAGSCAGSGECHGSAGERGAQASSFVCADAASCYASLRGQAGNEARALVKDADIARPEGSRLFGVLRVTTPNPVEGGTCESGSMPKSSSFRLDDAQTARLYQWILDGAKND
jgi:hypothetical protein